jgi:SOS-response transcriptional repressor LexA
MTLGQRLRQVRVHRGWTQPELAKRCAWDSQARISMYERDQREPGHADLLRLARVLDASPEWLLTGKEPLPAGKNFAPATPEFRAVPLLTLQEIPGLGTVVRQGPPKSRELMTELETSVDAFAITVEGESMLPDFAPGDRVVIDPAVKPQPGDFVVTKLEAETEATFRKYRLRGRDATGQDIIDLVPLNDDYPVVTMDSDNPGHLIGTMVEHRRYRKR